MCLIVFAWRPGQRLPLVLAANRDEFHARPSLPLAEWPDAPGLYAGRDLAAGGSWLGIGANGRFAALTNIRDPRQAQGTRSRGALVADYLRGGQAPEGYLAEIAARADAYGGFNLLLGDPRHLYYLNAREGRPRLLPAGLYGLSNAALDSPWPKLQRCKAALGQALAGSPEPAPEELLALLADRRRADDRDLPDTGVGLELEHLLSSPFIVGDDYGTRASTVLLRHADGRQHLLERSFGPGGARLGEVELVLPGSPAQP